MLSIFSGAEDQIVSSFTRTATRNGNYETLSEGDISPERVFPSYPWKTIKNVLIDKFVFFGRICSIAIGVYTIFSLIKSIITMMLNCVLLKKIGAGVLDVCQFTISPSTFILKNFPTKHEDLYANLQSKNNSKDHLLEPKKFNEINSNSTYPKLETLKKNNSKYFYQLIFSIHTLHFL